MRLDQLSKRVLSGTVAYTLLLTSIAPPPAKAGVLGGFATEWTQLANNVQLVTTYIRQGEELRQKILMVADMAKQATELPMQIFGPIMAEIANLHGVVQNGRALAYSCLLYTSDAEGDGEDHAAAEQHHRGRAPVGFVHCGPAGGKSGF